ncbi:MAG: EAL domain-containing protein [Candidatus Dadabacteria bacterium]|nr:EAL domain-containing protein [Candidatus Dadabacteria bacterium]NIV42982.1 EAL domain-containing protein [Candidatus Dadabacteria bacterium]NIX16189.1 EAL domain-containing protein [Candidatus Dadabacteria bacterium]
MTRIELQTLEKINRTDFSASDFTVHIPEALSSDVESKTSFYDEHSSNYYGYEQYIESFNEMMDKEEVVSYFQPIVELGTTNTIGFEMLGRTFYGNLPGSPEQLFSIASVFGLEDRLSRLFRLVGMNDVRNIDCLHNIFVNAHPKEMNNLRLLVASLSEIRRLAPDHPITLEINEKSVLSLNFLKELRVALDDLNIKMAFDDFGAGQSRVIELAEAPPDYVKFDRVLIENIHKSSVNLQCMVKTLLNMLCDLGVSTVAEGIECREEYEYCAEIGFNYGQGYYFGRPARIEHIPQQ